MTDAVIVGALFAAAGAAMAVGLVGLAVLARRSLTWPATQGTVRSSEVVGGGGPVRKGARGYRLHVVYEFVVNGHRIVGTRMWFGNAFWGWQPSEKCVEQLRDRFAPGTTVTVYYEPAYPNGARSAVASTTISTRCSPSPSG